jgi:hypothetical protein
MGHLKPTTAETDVEIQRGAAVQPPGSARLQASTSNDTALISLAANRKWVFAALIGFILWLAFLPGVVVLVNAEEEQPIVITKKQLKTAAYGSLWRLKRSIERDGYYSSRVALNVWRSNAIDAGLFKQEEYDQYKQQIFEKSIESNQRCFERALEDLNYTDASKCLLTWKLHTEEMGWFDAARYQEMETRLEAIKNQKTQQPEVLKAE